MLTRVNSTAYGCGAFSGPHTPSKLPLGCELWRQLQLDRFWSEKLPQGRESVAWPQVLELLVVNRLIEPVISTTLNWSTSIV